MSVKENVMIAGGVAAVIGIGKALTRESGITNWMWSILIAFFVAFIGFGAFVFYEQQMISRARKSDDISKADQDRI